MRTSVSTSVNGRGAVPAQRPAGWELVTPTEANRTITVPILGGGIMSVPCPEWCVLDHAEEIERGVVPADLWHIGEEIALELPGFKGATEKVLTARIDWMPFGDEGRVPSVGLWASEDAQPAENLTPEDLDDVIARAEAHTARLRELREQLAAVRAEYRANWDACIAARAERRKAAGK